MSADFTQISYLKSALVDLANAAKYMDMLIIESGAKQGAKHFLKAQINKIMSVERDMRIMVSPELAKIIRDEISENWDTLGIKNVTQMMMHMTNEQINQVESYAKDLIDPNTP